MSKYDLISQYRVEGKTWEEMKALGVSDNDRKAYYGYLDGIEATSEEATAVLRQKEELLKKEISILKQINSESFKHITEHKMIQEEKKKTVLEEFQLPPLREVEKAGKFKVVTTSDFHYNGEQSQLNRLAFVRDEIVNVIKEENLEHLFLAELGDAMEGATLRTSQLRAIKSGIVTQTLEIAKAYKLMVEEIIEKTGVKLTYIGVQSSNHTQLRNLGTKPNQLVDEDMMVVFNDKVQEAKGLHKVYLGREVALKIGGFWFYFAHGHEIKNKEGYIQAVGKRLGIDFDYAFFGHFHHMRLIELYKKKRDGIIFDATVIYVPALANEETQYERDKNLSSASGIGSFDFDYKRGLVGSKKIVIE